MIRPIVMIAVMTASAWFFHWGIPWLFRRYPRPVWRYPADTPVERLHRHHRLAAYSVYAFFFCIVGAVSSLLQVVVLGWQGWTTWMLVAYTVGMVVFAVPAFALGAWMGEVERECRERGIPVPTLEHLRSRVRSDAVMLAFWILVALAAPWVVRMASGG